MIQLSRACEDLITAWLLAAASADDSDCADLATAADAHGAAIPRPLLAGHAATELPEPGYLVVSAEKAGGPFARAGIFEVPLHVRVVDLATTPGLAAQEKSCRALEGLLEPRNIYAVLDSLIAFAATSNARLRLSGYRPAEPFTTEGRDPEKNHHGTIFHFSLCASLKADTEE